jgi:hypothetical protein
MAVLAIQFLLFKEREFGYDTQPRGYRVSGPFMAIDHLPIGNNVKPRTKPETAPLTLTLKQSIFINTFWSV